ncbi:MAG TPA: pilus assembly protein N-terminal domain-containing protein [Stellaceae bacterium]|nr:pilus assembly protein N-terminal domain-containing protein [Stellaceae bacterium]
MTSSQPNRYALAAFIALLGASPCSQAQTAPSAALLRLTVNHADVVTTDGTAASIVVANPDIADIVHEKPNLIFVFGRKPGATNLFAYDDSGHRLIAREVVVVPDNERMVTVTRVSSSDIDVTDYYCEPRCVYFARQETLSSTTTALPNATATAPSPAAAPSTLPSGGGIPSALTHTGAGAPGQ